MGVPLRAPMRCGARQPCRSVTATIVCQSGWRSCVPWTPAPRSVAPEHHTRAWHAHPSWVQRRSHACQALPDVITTLAESPARDGVCLGASVVGATALVKLFKTLASKGVIGQNLSRKLVHMLSGPLFVLTWTLFSANPSARLLSACVPFLNFTRLFLVGSGTIQDEGLVKSVSRSGDKGELLKGPLYYCIVLIVVTLVCWRDTPAAMVTLSLMCGGDGLADIVGRRFGSAKLPYNRSKSWAGSLAMLCGGAGMALGLIYAFSSLEFFPSYPPEQLLAYVFGIALVATVVESLPINQQVDDNISVPLVSLLLSIGLAAQLEA